MSSLRLSKWSRIAIVYVIAVAIITVAGCIFLLCQKQVLTITGAGSSVIEVNASEFNNFRAYAHILTVFRPGVYVSEKATRVVSVGLLKYIGCDVKVFRSLSSLRLSKEGLIILDISDLLSQKDVLDYLVRITKHVRRVAIMVLNVDRNVHAAKRVIELMTKFYSTVGTRLLLPLSPNCTSKVRSCKIHEGVLKAQALVFTINPNGIIIVDDLVDFPQTLILILRWSKLIPEPNSTDSRIVRFLGAMSIYNVKGFKYIQSIGWIVAKMHGKVCGEVTGYMAIKVDYYYANVTLPSGIIYHGWLIHVVHVAKGYRTICNGVTIHHYPKIFITKIDWLTEEYPGQILDDWQPKNFGTAAEITYTIVWEAGASGGVEPSAEVKYEISKSITTPNGPYYEWYDISDPPWGVAAVKHVVQVPQDYDISKLDNVLFTVEPSSVGYLDPTKPGGVLPMIVKQYFKTILNTGDEAEKNFTVELWPNTVTVIKG